MKDIETGQLHAVVSKYIRAAAFQLLILLICAAIVVITGFVSACIALYLYDIHHEIPDAVARGDDLGVGIVGVISMVGSTLISVPLAIAFHIWAWRRRKRQRPIPALSRNQP